MSDRSKADPKIPVFKLWLSDFRSCRHCNERIRQAVLTDNTRQWTESDHDEWCVGNPPTHAHEPFDRPGADLAAWLES